MFSGHDARTAVPFPFADSTAKIPPESSVRAFMFRSPNPPHGTLLWRILPFASVDVLYAIGIGIPLMYSV